MGPYCALDNLAFYFCPNGVLALTGSKLALLGWRAARTGWWRCAPLAFGGQAGAEPSSAAGAGAGWLGGLQAAKRAERAEAEAARFREVYGNIKAEVGRMMVGQDEVVQGVLTALFAGGHVLLEAYPAWARPCWCAASATRSTSRSRASSSPPT